MCRELQNVRAFFHLTFLFLAYYEKLYKMLFDYQQKRYLPKNVAKKVTLLLFYMKKFKPMRVSVPNVCTRKPGV